MSEGQNIIGFTEAELGLVVAVLFIALAIWKNPVEKPQPANPPVVKPDAGSDQRELDELRKQNRELKDKLKELRSRQMPTCQEKGIASGFLMSVVVSGPNTFRVGQNTYDLKGLLESLAPDLAAAEKAGCLHSVRIYYVNGIGLEAFEQGRRALRNHFYGDSFGPEPSS